jgi:preprotein translocase SecE subunit
VANKMAEKKKSASRSQTADLKTRGSEKEQPAKNARVATREERKEPKVESSKPKVESKKAESKPAARRESKSTSSLMARIRSNRIGRFILEAYYELRHKVTWPTFEQARNMTIAVIIISAVVGLIIGATDFGLTHLFFLIIGSK